MVGDFTPSQVAQVRKMHRIRAQRVRDVFKFYKTHNHLYASVVPNEGGINMADMYDETDHVFVEHVDVYSTNRCVY